MTNNSSSNPITAFDIVNDLINELKTDPAGVKERHLETERAYRRGWVHALASLHAISVTRDDWDILDMQTALLWYLGYSQIHRNEIGRDFNMQQIEKAFRSRGNE